MKNKKSNSAKKLNSFLFEGKKVETWMTKEQYSQAKQIQKSFEEPVKEQLIMTGATEKIQNMRTSLHIYPSFAQKQMDEQGNASLSNCTYRTYKCGCEIIGNGTLQNPLEIKLCGKHKKKQNNFIK